MTTNQVQITVEHDVLDEPCPRCGSTAVRAVVYSSSMHIAIEPTDAAADPFDVDGPLFVHLAYEPPAELDRPDRRT